ncbi:MAG: type VI secretion system baseplate subunit TssG [Pseudomonadota bacterium]
MSDADENDQKTKVVPEGKPLPADKTIVQVGAAPSVWPDTPPEPEDKVPDANSHISDLEEQVAQPDDPGVPFTEDEISGDAISSHAIEAPSDADAEEAAIDETEVEAERADADEAVEQETLEQVDAQPAPDVPDFPDDQEQEQEPVAEARIEVPVQQQFASLLSALSDRVQKHPGGHDLLAVLRMLEGQTGLGGAQSGMGPKVLDEPAPPRIGKSRRKMEDIVRFGQDPTGEFATSTIERATRDADDGLVLLERFLGLLGPHGALPSAYTDEAIVRGLQGDDSFPRFLDVFNNRFVQFFFRAWADARPIVQHDRPDDDRFLSYLGSSIGIGSPIYQDLDRVDDRLKLLFAGLTSTKVKSAARLKALITGVFGVDVEIDQCVGTWLHLDPDDQLSIGGLGPGGAGQLGMDTIVGSKVYSVSDKIRIRIFTSSLEEYRKFLPPTRTRPNPWTEQLFDLIDFYLGLEIEYEIELALPKRCASSVRMDSTSSATLGHIGWLKPVDAVSEDQDTSDDEEEMLTDTRFRPVRRHTTVYQ